VLAEGRGDDYTRELLVNCLRLDPFNHLYHKTLRELNHKTSRGVLGRLFSPLNVLASKSKMHLARSNGDWRRVLEYGEDVLAHQPANPETHLEMAEAAERLGLSNLAMWFLEQGREEAPQSSDLVRAMARLYEQTEDWRQAIALWEKVRQLEPNDREAWHKVNDLSVEEHLAKGSFRR
jgi:tetratricopeptide (TPR) repeat protein